ncbi:MAG TPA: hypothetical protein DEF34_07670 [Desulfotomaculum sp.]|nr:MAG: hypothetical protein JL56_04010 [Desulfotomaculum sp. BICA1-6]HBX23490.1 hypothetical protein [Desulfotomaculum sp.]
MNCDNRMNTLYAWFDGELGPAEAAEMERHIQTCPRCREELALWEEVRITLRDEAAVINAPPGLATSVMEQISRGKKPRVLMFPMAWRRGIAVAAATILIACGSIAAVMQTDLLNKTHLAGNDKNPTFEPANNGHEVTVPLPDNNDPAQGTGSPGETGNEEPDTEPDTDFPKDEPGTDGNKDNDHSEQDNATKDNNAAETDATMVALLNTDKERVIHSTLVRIKVAETVVAQDRLSSITSKYTVQQGQRDSIVAVNGSREVFELLTNQDEAEPLMKELGVLGQVTAMDGSDKDISGQYNQQVERYQSLRAQLMDASETEEKQAIEAEMNSIVRNLEAWEKDIVTHKIVVWLEK